MAATCKGVFVTGTDTGVGKTTVAVALLETLAASGLRAVGMKPVSAGVAPGRTTNADVEALLRAGNVAAPPADRNPYAFTLAIAPHLAAASVGTRIELAQIVAAHARLAASADVVVVEGAGGVRVPIGPRLDMLDIAAALRLPVLLVVGMRLGCLNHALLSAAAIKARGVRLAAWVANAVDPGMAAVAANVADLTRRLEAPLVAEIAWQASPQFSRATLDLLRL